MHTKTVRAHEKRGIRGDITSTPWVQMRAWRVATMIDNEKKEEYHCEVCGREISKEEYET